MTYMVTVTRAASMDATLSVLDLWLYPMTDPMTEIGDLTTTFMADTMSYTVMAENSVEQRQGQRRSNPHDGATVAVNGTCSGHRLKSWYQRQRPVPGQWETPKLPSP